MMNIPTLNKKSTCPVHILLIILIHLGNYDFEGQLGQKQTISYKLCKSRRDTLNLECSSNIQMLALKNETLVFFPAQIGSSSTNHRRDIKLEFKGKHFYQQSSSDISIGPGNPNSVGKIFCRLTSLIEMQVTKRRLLKPSCSNHVSRTIE